MQSIGQRTLHVFLLLLLVSGVVGARGFAANAPSLDGSSRASSGSSSGFWAFGQVQGVALGPDGKPIPGATIKLRKVSDDAEQDEISREDGSFAIGDLAPGIYEATAAANGYGHSHTAFFDITPGASVHEDLKLQDGADASPQAAAAPIPAAPAPTQKRGFFTRLGHAYLDDWTVDSSGAPPAPTPERRGTPAPLNSPPFPGADWPIGGTVEIGAPDYNTYILMQAINENKGRFKIYGWIDIGGNASTSNKGRYANNETAYDVIPNSIQLDQAALYFERLPDTVQTDHIDWGFRFTSLYGLDYRYTTAKGVFSQQLLRSNDTYGYDPVMYYFDLYLPHLGEGTDVRIGRYISLPDIEAQLAPNNYTYSHSITYTYDCYTQQGVNATTRVSNHWTIQAGVSAGCESAPWISNAKLTGNACAAYSWSDGGDNLYACANSINSGKYAYNNLAAYYLTYYHKINATWHTDTEAWYQYIKDVPNLCFELTPCISYGSNANIGANAGEITGPSLITGANGAQCNPLATHCFAPDYAIVNYIEHEFNNHHSSLTIRNEYVDDLKGQRTGSKTKYSEHLVGLNFWLGSTVTFRPELRFEHSYDVPAYDSPSVNGVQGAPTKTTQLTLAGDLIYHF
jgi:Putative beta-barrel porin-2, OmpL-like. bbp2/Carboxypeptidase regulatory-like domain